MSMIKRSPNAPPSRAYKNGHIHSHDGSAIARNRPQLPARLPPTHTIPGELHQVEAYVQATNTRVKNLEQLVEPSSVRQVSEIKQELKKAHRGLESVQNNLSGHSIFPMIASVTRQTWHAYRRVVRLEENLRKQDATAVCDNRGARHEPVSYVPNGAARAEGSTKLGMRKNKEAGGEGGFMMSSAIPGDRSYVEGKQDLIKRFPVPPSNTDRQYIHNGNGFEIDGIQPLSNGGPSKNDIQENNSLKTDSLHVSGRRRIIKIPKEVNKTPGQVRDSILREEAIDSEELQDPDGKREGSADGTFITAAVMSGFIDPRFIIPKFDCIKVHEVKALKQWLEENPPGKKYLNRSGSSSTGQSRHISRIEKVLHLIFILQMGCRFETIAILFSRTPKQIQRSCNEVLEGLIQMHSETVLPRGATSLLYARLWYISRKFETEEQKKVSTKYYLWSTEDIGKALIAINMFIGRFRMQGKFALEGPFWDWGPWVQLDDPNEHSISC